MGAEKGSQNDLMANSAVKLNLNLTQKIWLLFVVPTALHCAIYMADVATDIALVEKHFGERRYIPAVLTLLIIYAPAAVFLALTLMDKKQRPPKEKDATGTWILKQIGLAVLFPIHAMHRFAGKLFWGIEAIYGPREQLEESLAEAMKPSFAELYLLLQPFLQGIPQALLQTYIIMNYKVPQERTGAVQLLSITTSVLSVAIAAAVYMRFETKRSEGKPTPWAYDQKPRRKSLAQKESLMTTIDSHIATDPGEVSSQAGNSPKHSSLPKGIPQTAILSLPPLPPNIRARLLKASGDEIPEDLQKEVPQVEQQLNIRSSLYTDNAGGGGKGDMESLDFTITFPSLSPAMKRAHSPDQMSDGPMSPDHSLPPSPLPPLPPSPPEGGSPLHEAPLPPLPESPPPSPEQDPEEDESYDGSVHEAQTNEVTGTTTPDTNLAEHTSRERLIEPSTASIGEKPTTTLTPMKEYNLERELEFEGLNEEEMVGKAIAFSWWFCFVLSRILTLSTLAYFYPIAFFIVAGVHYLGMTSYLFSCGQTDLTSTKILRYALGFVFLFCIIEIRDRFRDAKSFAVGFVVLCTLENFVSSMVWFLLSAWTSWWFLYTFYVINVSLMLSILAMGLFHLILKPTGPKGKL